MSAYKIETWTKLGYTLEEAKYQIKIRRPTNVEYYIHKYNVDYDTALQMRMDYQKIGAKVSASRSNEEIRRSSPRCKEYWIEKGFNEEESILKVKEAQSTFNLDKCIEKHGLVEGTKIWQERQDKWQRTLNSKPEEERNIINSKKDIMKISNWINRYGENEGTKKFIEYIDNNTDWGALQSLTEIENKLKEVIQYDLLYLPLTRIKKTIPNYVWQLVSKPKNIDEWLKSFLELKAPSGNIVFKTQLRHGFYQMWVGNKLLRSSNEIYFYELLIEKGLKPDIDFNIEKYYENSMMRCDFYLIRGGCYIELAGYSSEPYLQKMLYKESTFGSIILYNKSDYKQFIDNYYSVIL